jgi:hypothetical protein
MLLFEFVGLFFFFENSRPETNSRRSARTPSAPTRCARAAKELVYFLLRVSLPIGGDLDEF